MKTRFIALLLFSIPLIMKGQNTGWSYIFDPASEAEYTLSCGEISPKAILMKHNSCNFYTPMTTVGDSDEWLYVNAQFNGSKNLDQTDFIWIFYYVNGATLDTRTISGITGETKYEFTDSVLIPAGATLKIRIAFVCNGNDEYWSLQKNNLELQFGKTETDVSANTEYELPEQKNIVSTSRERNFVRVKWITTPSASPNYFKIEKSTDGKNFSFTGFVREHNMHGNGSGYSFIDTNPSNIRSWYRIKQVDEYGNETVIGETAQGN